MSQKLPKQISSKLDQLHQLLTKISEAQVINSDDPTTWDSDTLYNLVANLKETIKLLKDTEAGLCSLVDSYHSKKEND